MSHNGMKFMTTTRFPPYALVILVYMSVVVLDVNLHKSVERHEDQSVRAVSRSSLPLLSLISAHEVLARPGVMSLAMLTD